MADDSQPQQAYVPTDSDWELYEARRDELQDDMRSMSDEFDKSILTLSSGGLGLSLAFVKDIVPLKQASFIWLLNASWFMFVGAIVATLTSYLMSLEAAKRALKDAEKYYLEDRREYLKQRSWQDHALTWLRVASASCFVLAVVLTGFFVAFNLQAGRDTVSDSQNNQLNQKVTSPVDETKGRHVTTAMPKPTVGTTNIPKPDTGRNTIDMVPKPEPSTPPTKLPEKQK